MVTLNFKLHNLGRLERSISGSVKLADLLQQCAAEAEVTLGSTIAVRSGKVVRKDDEVVDGDWIDIFPAISGG